MSWLNVFKKIFLNVNSVCVEVSVNFEQLITLWNDNSTHLLGAFNKILN